MKTIIDKWANGLYIVLAIVSKDIVDAIKSKMVLSLILGSGIMLFLPRVMGLMIEEPATPVIVYDPGASGLVAAMAESDQFSVRPARSIADLETMLSNLGMGLGPELGLAVPPDFDLNLESGGQVSVDGYVEWANRFKAPALQADFETRIGELIGQPVSIRLEGHTVYPQPASLALGILTISTITVMLMLGITLVPHLFFEEKQTRTIEALLVSPVSIAQVVVGKALVGLFYTVVVAGVVLGFYWSSMVHWWVVLLFVIACGAFAVAVGLVMGSIFESQQEVTGWISVIIVILVGAMFVDMIGLEVPAFVEAILPWVPSVSLMEMYRLAQAESIPQAQVWVNMGSVLGISALLYAVVVWRVRRMDR